MCKAKDSEITIAHKRRIQGMFNAIAGRYDLLNHLLSAGVDVYWRRKALAMVRRRRPHRILDLATGTADLALAAAALQPERGIVGIDVAQAMLRIGASKVKARGNGEIRLIAGDAEQLPFGDDRFELVTAAFGVRNFGDIPAGLREAWRVLAPGGELVIVDFTEPTLPVFKQLYRFYFRRILPLVGGVISGNRRAYSYLPSSVGTFPQHAAFLKLMEEAGFDATRHKSLSLGICAVYQGLKPEG